MEEAEIEELFSQLRAAGYKPMLCDARIKVYETPVMCGDPTLLGDVTAEEDWYPKEMMNPYNLFKTPARGDSMKDAGIDSGDMLTIKTDVTVRDGDIVMATVDGRFTVKAYLEDEDGEKWLVPYNDRYRPIHLTEEMNCRIVGRVVEVSKENPRVSTKESLRKIRKQQERKKTVSMEQLETAITEVAPEVKNVRQWIGVFRATTQTEVYGRDDYEAFCTKVALTVPEHDKLPTVTELQRMDVDSFRKKLSLWDENDAPVSGKRFRDYRGVGLRTLELLSA